MMLQTRTADLSSVGDLPISDRMVIFSHWIRNRLNKVAILEGIKFQISKTLIIKNLHYHRQHERERERENTSDNKIILSLFPVNFSPLCSGCKHSEWTVPPVLLCGQDIRQQQSETYKPAIHNLI